MYFMMIERSIYSKEANFFLTISKKIDFDKIFNMVALAPSVHTVYNIGYIIYPSMYCP